LVQRLFQMFTLNNNIFKEFPNIETNRLTLRSLNLTDAETIFEMRTNDRISEFIPRHKLQKIEDAISLIKKTNNLFQSKQGIGWAGFTKEGNHLIGTCGFNKIDFENFRAEIGGEMSVSYWGRNYAKEAVEAIIDFGFKKLKLNSIEARVSPENRSVIYLLKKLGFTKEAHFRQYVYFNNDFLDLAIFTLHNEKET